MGPGELVTTARRSGWVALAIGVGCFLIDPLANLLLWGIGGLPLDTGLRWWESGFVTFMNVVSSVGTWLIAAAVVLLIVARVAKTTATGGSSARQVFAEDDHA